MSQNKFSISKRAMSFVHAFNGLKLLIKSEHNARIHIAATILVIAAGCWFEISGLEWSIVIIVSGLVFIAELFNTSIEHLSNFVSPTYSDAIKKVKDLAAAAVLIAAVTALVVGLTIFFPKILPLIN